MRCVHGKVSSDISHAQRGGGADICGCEEDARHDSANEMHRHYYLKTSDALTDEDKAYFAKMLTGTDENIEDSIRKLSQLLYKHHGKKAVIIIDEYDVPLDKAYQNGYYREMVSLIRGLFGQALKTNDYLQFAFLTGCLQYRRKVYLQDWIILRYFLLWIPDLMNSLDSQMMR